jgi:uncharacterized membrane protein YhdT
VGRHKRLNTVLKWAGFVILWLIYAVAVAVMTGEPGPFWLMLSLQLLPIVVVLLCWLYVRGPRENT